MRLYIKNMVCNRCIKAVQQELTNLNIPPFSITLGEVETTSEPSANTINQFRQNLAALGFELLDDSRQQLIEKIKNTVIKQIHYTDNDKHHNFSDILSKALHKDYSYLSNIFSAVEGITIEKYVINQKIERVKELIMYDELNLGEIADKLGYSSSAYMSNQFKKVTGLTPTHFKQVKLNKRKPLDEV